MKTLSDYRERPHWSYSSINQLLNICSLQFYFQRVEQLAPSSRPLGLAFGSAFHRVMEWIAHHRQDGGIPNPTEAAEHFQDAWEHERERGESIRFDERHTPESCAKQGRSLCALYVEQLVPDEQVMRVSEVFVVPVGQSEKPLIGELDCVTERAGQTTIVDWKTSARRCAKTQAEHSLQATAYLYAHQQLHPDDPVDFRFEVLVKNKKPVLEHHVTQRDLGDFQRLEKLVALAERIVEQELYYPSDASFYCSGCPFADACAAWHTRNLKLQRIAA